MTVARKETPIGNRACVRLCVRVFVEGHVYRELPPPLLSPPASRPPSPPQPILYRRIVGSYTFSLWQPINLRRFLLQAITERELAILECARARDRKTTESKKPLSGSDVVGINFISRRAVSTHATTGNESFCTCLGKRGEGGRRERKRATLQTSRTKASRRASTSPSLV